MQFEFIGASRQDPDNSQASPARLLNMYRENIGEKYVLKRVLGMTAFCDLGDAVLRALANIRGYMYAVSGGNLYIVGPNGSDALYGAVGDDPHTTISSNNGPIAVTAGGDYYLWTGATITTPSTGAFSSVGSAVFWGQRTVLSELNGRRIQWSDVADAATFDALNFATAEGRDDNIIRLLVNQGQLWIFGDRSIERWYLTGGDDFAAPMAGAEIDTGLKAFNLLTDLPNGAFFVGDDNIAYLASGGGLKPVSSRAVETAVKQGMPSHCFYYEDEGHKFCVIRFDDRPAWVYDVSSDEWHERANGDARVLWDAIAAAQVFGRDFVGFGNGNIYELERTNVDATGPLVGVAVSRNIRNGGAHFSIDRVGLLCTVGESNFTTTEVAVLDAGEVDEALEVGSGDLLEINEGAGATGPRPAKVIGSFSRDRGKTFGVGKARSLGTQGDYDTEVVWRALGVFNNAVMRLIVADADEITIESVCEVEAG